MKTQSDTIGKIVEALTKAQLEFEPIIKDVKSHHNKFAPLSNCFDSTRKALCNNGLSVSQPINILDDGRSIIETTLGHISGEFFKSYTDLSQLILNIKGRDPLHAWGGIITYTRRYSYLSIIGAISEDEDNDGSDIQIRNNYTNKNQPQPQPIPIQTEPLIPDPLITQLIDLIKTSGCDVVDFTKYYNITSSDMSSIKEAVNNFDEFLIDYRNSKQTGVNNEKETKI